MNQEKINRTLEKHYHAINTIILSRQDPITGLLPASTAINAHGDYTDAWVRDNVYSILSVWGLALSYRKHHPDHHRSYLLSQSVVKLMRGLLSAMMRQSDHVEAFKSTLNPLDALHAKYGTKTALSVVGDGEWGHLQLDASSLFLLMIAQMTASGLRLIYTMDEVNFVQNMVHYISRTYCTPDFGIWERGNKINHGETEINCSSVGMAKAALEAMDGFNLFGNVASHEAVIHVVPNDVARSRFTLRGLLPRESNSKETDAALLSIIGYPAYAIEDEELAERTRNKVIKKLAGNYGCKRFLLDGHQSSIEDESRLHYKPSELREFEHIESEWPLFFTYLLLDALMREDNEAVLAWQKKLEPLFVKQEGIALIPELFIVPKELIAAEKENPGSQKRLPNENLPLVWAQSLYMLSDMILDGVLRPSDIDPLHRRDRIGHSRSTHPLVSILAEDNGVKQKLLDLGFKSETLDEVKPLKVMHAQELSQVHTLLGKNDKLALSGRPLLETRTITTSRLHLLSGEECIFLPYYFNPKSFYFSYDNKLLVEHFRSSLKFLALHWDQAGQPIIPFLVREDMLLENDRDEVLELLHELQTGNSEGVVVKTNAIAQQLSTAAVERIDYLHDFELKEIEINADLRGNCNSSKDKELSFTLSLQELHQLEHASDEVLSELIVTKKNRLEKAIALDILWQRQGSDYKIFVDNEAMKLSHLAEQHYESATLCHDWVVVRRLAEITKKYDDRLEDALLDIVTRQKRLAVGRAYNEKATFSKPLESTAIVKSIAEFCGNNNAENVLTQEIILHLGHLVRTAPELFKNILTLRPWYFVQLLVGQISRDHQLAMGDAYEFLISLAPNAIYSHLRSILSSLKEEATQLSHQENLNASGIKNLASIKAISLMPEHKDVDDWSLWRSQRGMIARMTPIFYKDVWHLLQQCHGLVIGDKYNIENRLGSEFTLETTAGERSFELAIETLLQSIQASDYRQLNIEAIESLARLFRENPDIKIEDDLILDVLIGHAARISWSKNHAIDNYDEQRAQAWDGMYHLSPKESDEAFIEAFMHLLRPHE